MRCPATLTGHSPFSVALPTVQKSFRCEFQWQTRAHTRTHTHTCRRIHRNACQDKVHLSLTDSSRPDCCPAPDTHRSATIPACLWTGLLRRFRIYLHRCAMDSHCLTLYVSMVISYAYVHMYIDMLHACMHACLRALGLSVRPSVRPCVPARR